MSRQMAERAESATGGGWRGALRRGWRVGKAAAIAIAAAPVVVPPLLVLSALGAALSLPFGAYLASLACTDRLMRSLLPPPQYQEDEFLEAAEEEKPLQGIELAVENEADEEDQENKRAAEEEVVVAKAAEEGGSVAVEEERAAEIEKMDAEITEIEANGTGGSPRASVASGVAPQDENIGAARKVFEEMIVSSKEGGVREERVIAVADNVVAGTAEPSGGVVVESVEIVGESEPPAGFSSGYASAVEDQSVQDTADVESRSSVEHAGAFIAADIMVAVETETAASFDVEFVAIASLQDSEIVSLRCVECERLIEIKPTAEWKDKRKKVIGDNFLRDKLLLEIYCALSSVEAMSHRRSRQRRLETGDLSLNA
uniref:Uncharacterized protein n=1 Tax=Ananas comosus var. bracteatus TaxID=296719 RepID=A0A6V7NXL2_ANACO|nr:unnamed protein product [Ananas comosus var. bracteatus]